jgi:hypothetical protein
MVTQAARSRLGSAAVPGGVGAVVGSAGVFGCRRVRTASPRERGAGCAGSTRRPAGAPDARRWRLLLA